MVAKKFNTGGTGTVFKTKLMKMKNQHGLNN